MGYYPIALQNATGMEIPTIIIKKGDPEWDKAYQNWKKGEHSTNSPEWEKGICCCKFKLKEKNKQTI